MSFVIVAVLTNHGVMYCSAFSIRSPLRIAATGNIGVIISATAPTTGFIRKETSLFMSDRGGGGGSTDLSKKKKKGIEIITADRVETDVQEDKEPEDEWRVVLHNDEVHTFQYVVQALIKVIGTLDRKRAFDICVVTHGTGKATITTAWKEQAMKYCLAMQRQGLTASIAPESRFDGEGDGGGDDGGGGGGDAGQE